MKQCHNRKISVNFFCVEKTFSEYPNRINWVVVVGKSKFHLEGRNLCSPTKSAKLSPRKKNVIFQSRKIDFPRKLMKFQIRKLKSEQRFAVTKIKYPYNIQFSISLYFAKRWPGLPHQKNYRDIQNWIHHQKGHRKLSIFSQGNLTFCTSVETKHSIYSKW